MDPHPKVQIEGALGKRERFDRCAPGERKDCKLQLSAHGRVAGNPFAVRRGCRIAAVQAGDLPDLAALGGHAHQIKTTL